MKPTLAVIIPVYNASKYIVRCLESCMIQRELDEIIVINDGSTDDSLTLIKIQASKDLRVKIYQHEDKDNHGRSASRNLGILNCTSTWVTFLDADDYYKKDRFRDFFKEDLINIDGTYEGVLSAYSTPQLRGRVTAITSINDDVAPDDLVNYLISNRERRISIISLILTKALCEVIGCFDVTLNIGEDTDFIWRAASRGSLRKTGRSEIKVVRQVHEGNTYTDPKALNVERLKFYSKWRSLATENNISADARKRIEDSYKYYQFTNDIEGQNQLRAIPIKVWYYLSKAFKI